jgi:hypothetical protein
MQQNAMMVLYPEAGTKEEKKMETILGEMLYTVETGSNLRTYPFSAVEPYIGDIAGSFATEAEAIAFGGKFMKAANTFTRCTICKRQRTNHATLNPLVEVVVELRQRSGDWR